LQQLDEVLLEWLGFEIDAGQLIAGRRAVAQLLVFAQKRIEGGVLFSCLLTALGRVDSLLSRFFLRVPSCYQTVSSEKM